MAGFFGKKLLKQGAVGLLGGMASPLGGTVWPHHGRRVPLLGGAARRTNHTTPPSCAIPLSPVPTRPE